MTVDTAWSLFKQINLNIIFRNIRSRIACLRNAFVQTIESLLLVRSYSTISVRIAVAVDRTVGSFLLCVHIMVQGLAICVHTTIDFDYGNWKL